MNSNLAYEEEGREELINGQVFMSPRPIWNHNRVAFNIAVLFEHYLRGKRCTAVSDGTDLYLTEQDRFVPDVMIVCDPDKIQWNGVHGAPDLVVEVLSPGTARNDRGHKKDVYEQCGVKEYWLVNPADQSVEIYRADGSRFVLHNIYAVRSGRELAQMSEAERAAVETHFQCSLFDDLDIALEDIFYRTI